MAGPSACWQHGSYLCTVVLEHAPLHIGIRLVKHQASPAVVRLVADKPAVADLDLLAPACTAGLKLWWPFESQTPLSWPVSRAVCGAHQ